MRQMTESVMIHPKTKGKCPLMGTSEGFGLKNISEARRKVPHGPALANSNLRHSRKQAQL